jgi:hypothetical protein
MSVDETVSRRKKKKFEEEKNTTSSSLNKGLLACSYEIQTFGGIHVLTFHRKAFHLLMKIQVILYTK